MHSQLNGTLPMQAKIYQVASKILTSIKLNKDACREEQYLELCQMQQCLPLNISMMSTTKTYYLQCSNDWCYCKTKQKAVKDTIMSTLH